MVTQALGWAAENRLTSWDEVRSPIPSRRAREVWGRPDRAGNLDPPVSELWQKCGSDNQPWMNNAPGWTGVDLCAARGLLYPAEIRSTNRPCCTIPAVRRSICCEDSNLCRMPVGPRLPAS